MIFQVQKLIYQQLLNFMYELKSCCIFFYKIGESKLQNLEKHFSSC